MWRDAGRHTFRVKAYRASGASRTNRKRSHNRIIHGLLLMSQKHPSSPDAARRLKRRGTKLPDCSLTAPFAAPPTPTWRDSRKWETASWSHAPSACRVEPWPLGGARWASLTRASPPYVSRADWLRAAAEKRAGPESRAPHLEGARRWIIQTVPVVTISADMFPHLWTRTHTRRVEHTRPAS